MYVQVALDPEEWNSIVNKSIFSVLYHKYELCSKGNNALPLVIEGKGKHFLFPLRIVKIFGFRIATSPVYYYASLLPSDAECERLIPEVLEVTVKFLSKIGVDCLVTSVPTFLLESYSSTLSSWFKAKEASEQTIYAHMLRLKGKTYENIWKQDFSKHARNAVRKAEKKGVTTERIENVGKWIGDIVNCNISSLKRQRRPMGYPHCDRQAFSEYLRSHKKKFGECFRIHGALYDNRLIAYMTTTRFNKLVMITLAMSRSEYLSKAPNNALLSHIIRNACEEGFDWIYYSFDRMSAGSSKQSLVTSLRKFKFEHGFREVPIPIFRLGVTFSGYVFSRLSMMSNYAFIGSASLPQPLRQRLQYVYDSLAGLEKSRLYLPFHI